MGCGEAKANDPGRKEVVVNPNNFEDEYTLQALRGSGSIAEVWEAQHKESQKRRAVKIIKKSQSTEADLSKMIKDETTALATLDCENIVHIYELFEDEHRYYIVMELLDGPNMGDYLGEVPKASLNEMTVASWMKQILKALSHCHANNIIHGDIRPSNIVFAEVQAKTPKLIDFNFSQNYNPDDAGVQDVYAAPAYVAPELLTEKKYSTKTDVWSCGILCHYIIAGKIPYKAKTLKDLYAEIKASNFTEDSLKGDEWGAVSGDCKKFIARMLKTDVESRPSADEMLEDPWLNTTKADALVIEAQTKKVDTTAQLQAQKFSHAVMSYVIALWNVEEEKQNLSDLFHKMDINSDNLLNRTELRNALKKSGIIMSPIEFDKMFDELDKDRSGNVNYKEYMTATANNEALVSDAALKKAFDGVAKTKDGKIDKKLLLSLMKEGWMADVKMDEQFNSVHKVTGDKVTFADFKKALKTISIDKKMGAKLKRK